MANKKRLATETKRSTVDDLMRDEPSPYRDEVHRADRAASEQSDEFVSDAEIEAREKRRREKYG